MRRPLLVLLAVLGLSAGGCITPSIPIPPPSPEAMVFEVDVDTGAATFSYPPTDIYAGAIVYVFNRTAGVGVIDTARDDGGVGPTAPFPAALDDEIAVTFETEDQVVSTCVVLQDGGAVGSSYCGY